MLKKATYTLLIAIITLLITWQLSSLGAVRDFENQTVDIRQIAFSPETSASDQIVMVWLDDLTMKSLPYRSPVPRNFLAKLNDSLFNKGAKMVAYDVFFKGKSFPKDDEALADSLSRTRAFAVVPSRPLSFCKDKENMPEGASMCVDLPSEMFYKSLTGIGLADLPFSAFDSTVRRARFEFDTDLGKMPSIAATVYKTMTDENALEVISSEELWPGFGPVKFSPFVSKGGQTMIRFAGPPSKIGGKDNAFKVFSAKLVADGLIPNAWLDDKIVLVGAAYEDATDAYLTPYYGKATGFKRMYGVEIHANILSSLLTRQFFFSFAPWQIIILLTLISIIIASASFMVSPLKSALILLATLLLELTAAIWAFRSHAVIVPIVLPAACAFISYGLGIGLRALTEGRQKRFIKGVFSKYVPPAVVERMTQNPAMLKLGGEKRNVTSLFSDIASFTTISEKMDPEMLVSFLNDYLGRMNEMLFSYGATIDKYEGDAIIAFFNAPLDVENHELAAVKSAIEMKKISAMTTEAWGGRCGREIVTRVGVNSGLAVVGNMGSEGRFDYTAIGDTINLASRLEGTNKFYGTTLMVSEMTVDGIADDSLILRPVDRVRVKGKKDAILLYEIVGNEGEVHKEMIDGLITPFKNAFDSFSSRNIDEARRILIQISNKYNDDGPTLELLKRCDRATEDPNWDLVTDMTSK